MDFILFYLVLVCFALFKHSFCSFINLFKFNFNIYFILFAG
jgi:hypothetical protein